ncbi:MAG: type II/IV secretion system ATPase subunit [Bacilli bacterium]|nr:type II/IV secretion system ATPase subunit [Bacilli bacterium]
MNQGINVYDLTPKSNENKTNTEINDSLFSSIDFGPLKAYLDDDNITDISYSNNGQVWLKSLDRGVYRVDNPGINNDLMEKIAFQCANIMGKTFNMASPLLDSESSELRMNFIHDSIARNGIAAVFRKTPAKIRLEKEKIVEQKYITTGIHDFLIECVKGHCNIIVSGETGSGKTELVKYLASHTATNEKIITIEDTLELHLDKIFPERDIVSMKTNNIASYSDVLVGCMRQNPKWILLSEVRSAEAVTAVRNSISSGHNILSTIHADKASSIPYRLYSLLESNIDVEQFMTTIYRYIQLGIHVRARYDKQTGKFMREVCEVCEFFVNEENQPEYNIIYRKNVDGTEVVNGPSTHLIEYLESQGVDLTKKSFDNIKIPSPFEEPLINDDMEEDLEQTSKQEETKDNGHQDASQQNINQLNNSKQVVSQQMQARPNNVRPTQNVQPMQNRQPTMQSSINNLNIVPNGVRPNNFNSNQNIQSPNNMRANAQPFIEDEML